MATRLEWGLIGTSMNAREWVVRSLGPAPRKSEEAGASQARRAALEVRQLEYFVSIYDHGSMSRASAKLCVARSALSAQLAQLEAELGAILVRRSPSGVVPTQSGRILYQHARAILRQVSDAKSAVRQSCESPQGVVNVGILESVSAVLGLPLLRAIKDRFPSITLHLHEDINGRLLDQLKDDRLDLAVLFADGQLESLAMERIVNEKLHLISRQSRNGAAASNKVTLAAALNSPLILPGIQDGVRARLEEYAKAAGLTLNNLVAETDSLTVIKNAVLDGMGMTILPVSAVISELDHDLMLAQEIVSPTVTCTVALCSPKSMTINHAAQCVARLIVAVGTEICAIGRWPGEPVQDDHSETAQ